MAPPKGHSAAFAALALGFGFAGRNLFDGRRSGLDRPEGADKFLAGRIGGIQTPQSAGISQSIKARFGFVIPDLGQFFGHVLGRRTGLGDFYFFGCQKRAPFGEDFS